MQVKPKAIVLARRRAGLRQRDVAQVMDVAESTIRNLETGRVHQPHAGTLKALADALGVDVDDIAEPVDEEVEVA